VRKDHDATESGTEVDDLVVGKHGHLGHGRNDVVDAARKVRHRPAGEVGHIGRKVVDAEQFVGPDVAIDERNREQSVEKRRAAKRATPDLDPSGARLKTERVIHATGSEHTPP